MMIHAVVTPLERLFRVQTPAGLGIVRLPTTGTNADCCAFPETCVTVSLCFLKRSIF